MKNSILLLMLLFSSAVLYSESDTFIQKIAVKVDSASDYISRERILQKAVFSKAEGNTNIAFFPGDTNDLDILNGSSAINAIILIKTVQKNNLNVIELYDISKTPVLIDSSVSYLNTNFIRDLDKTAGQIFSKILLRYPPKKKTELTTVENVNVKVSEFESLGPEWSLRVVPTLFTYIYKVNLKEVSNSMNDSDSTFSSYSPGARVELLYRYLWFNAAAGIAADTGGTLNGRIKAAAGIFDSLFLLGFEINYLRISTDIQGKIPVGTNNISVNYPAIQYQDIWPCVYMQLNISKNYSISSVTGIFPLLSQANVDFKQDFKTTQDVKINSSNGPASYGFRFNWNTTPNLQIYLEYLYWSRKAQTDEYGQNGYPKPYDIGSGIQMRNLEIDQNQLGLGMAYVF